MIEQVAKAIALVENTHDCRSMARAAIAAMLNPTPAMIDAGYIDDDSYYDHPPHDVYQAMIEAALKEALA